MVQVAYLQRWNALHDTIACMRAAGSVDRAVEVVRETARMAIGADGVTVIRRIGNEVRYVAEDAISPLWTGQQFPIEMCVSGQAILHNRPVVIQDIERDDRVPLNLYLSTFVRSMAMFPVGLPEPTAAIGAYWRTRQDIDGKTIMLLSALARSLGSVFESLGANDLSPTISEMRQAC